MAAENGGGEGATTVTHGEEETAAVVSRAVEVEEEIDREGSVDMGVAAELVEEEERVTVARGGGEDGDDLAAARKRGCDEDLGEECGGGLAGMKRRKEEVVCREDHNGEGGPKVAVEESHGVNPWGGEKEAARRVCREQGYVGPTRAESLVVRKFIGPY